MTTAHRGAGQALGGQQFWRGANFHHRRPRRSLTYVANISSNEVAVVSIVPKTP